MKTAWLLVGGWLAALVVAYVYGQRWLRENPPEGRVSDRWLNDHHGRGRHHDR